MQRKPQWIRISESQLRSVPSPDWAEPVDEMFRWDSGIYQFPIQLHHLGNLKFGETTHVTIKKVDIIAATKSVRALFDSKEPTYEEKLRIINHVIGRGDIVAMEVIPSTRDVVDMANLYHVWVADKAKFPFGLREATELPEGKRWEKATVGTLRVEYIIRTVNTEFGKAAYLYLRRQDRKELCWKEKMLLKNEIQFDEVTAVEIISKHGVGKPTCLLVLPLDYKLDFGLHIF